MINLILFLCKGETEMMAMLFACRVVEGRTEFNKVPAKLKAQVAKILVEEFDLADIVPEEFGGTLKA
jgi:hypothetical protein